MRNGPVPIHYCYRNAHKLDAMDDIPMSHIEKLDCKLDQTSLTNYIIYLAWSSTTIFCRVSQALEYSYQSAW